MARKGYFAWSPVRGLMKTAGATIVSRSAVQTLIYFLEARAKKVTEISIALSKHSGRKKVSEKDVALTLLYL